jgi:hypothetical protein
VSQPGRLDLLPDFIAGHVKNGLSDFFLRTCGETPRIASVMKS